MAARAPRASAETTKTATSSAPADRRTNVRIVAAVAARMSSVARRTVVATRPVTEAIPGRIGAGWGYHRGMSAASTEPRHTNRLAAETSPYLLQHAHNPVDWYPWGPEALTKAKAEDKPIFLSIGYAACHWCHVMERESFEDEATADRKSTTSELQSHSDLVCRLLLEKKKGLSPRC